MQESTLQALIARLICDESFRREFETDRAKCLRGFRLGEAERRDLEALDLAGFLSALPAKQPSPAAHRAVKGGSLL
jgi:hypothetical protein